MMRIASILLLLATAFPIAAQDEPGKRMTKKEAAEWYKSHEWPVGCNYIPSTAINQLEMWQKETFDIKTIERELGWARDLGFNTVRVFLHDLPWKEDHRDFTNRIYEFLGAAHKNRIQVMFVLFDSCWDPDPKLGKQPAPRPGLHNSGWVQSPGVAVLKDPKAWKEKEDYVKGILREFKYNPAVLAWDLWNEPDNNNASSYGKLDLDNKEAIVLPLVKQVFRWAREEKPYQPITAAPWAGDWTDEEKLSPLNRFLFDNSDIITFHRYENLERTRKQADALKRYERPILCTEYMARPFGSTFEALLPLFKDQKIGAYCWGFVSGKTQTIYPWDSWKKPYDAEPKVWFHDILRADGKPYDAKEVEFIKETTGMNIELILNFSVKELDPKKPGESFVECVIRNKSKKPVKVPSNYAGGHRTDLTLHGSTYGGFREVWLVKWASDRKQETTVLRPGNEMVVFKDLLKDVLVLDSFDPKPLKPKEARYYWGWDA